MDPYTFGALIDAYVIECKEKNEPITLPGAALYLGVDSVSGKGGLEETGAGEGCERHLARLKTHVEQYAMRRVYSTTPTGGIFMLKTMGYSDGGQQQGTTVNVVLSEKDKKL